MRRLKKLIAYIVTSTFLISLSSGINIKAADTTSSSKFEFRGAWMSTVYNIDWPVARSGVDSQKSDFVNKVDALKSAGFNALFFQVRSMGDALYPSNYATWSQYISGSYGSNPGYDPTAFALEEVHKRGMEFQAWFNPFRIASSSSFDVNNYISKLPANSPLKAHPEWIVKYSGSSTYYWINLGIPEARKYVIDTIMEVVKNYDIDGVHIDDYFYPYPVYQTDANGNKVKVDFPDSNEFSKYGTSFSNKDDWRRDNVNQFISGLSSAIKSVKPQVKFGVSPFGIWKNSTGEGGAGTNGLSSYYEVYVDSKKWIDNQWIDYIVPQVYWNFGYSAADYQKLSDWWAKQVEGKNVSLYIGHAAYKIGDSSYGSAWTNSAEMPNQIKYSRQNANIKGDAFFSVKDILSNRLGILDTLKNDLYKSLALVPPMQWKDNTKPSAPVILSAVPNNSGIEVKWNKSASSDTGNYIVYRVNKGQTIDVNRTDNIVSILKSNGSSTYSLVDTSADKTKNYTYAVTALDKFNNESVVYAYEMNTPAITGITTSLQSPQKINSEIKITVNATGGDSALYRISVNNGSGWEVVQDYSSTTTCNWVPNSVGTYTIKADMKKKDSTQDYDYTMQIPFVINGIHKVAIDPGHGGSDSGSIGYSGAYEKDYNLSVSLKVRQILQSRGIDVLMTRDTDETVSLDERTDYANAQNVDILVSIHQNWFIDYIKDSSGNVIGTRYPEGIETYSYPGSVNGARLAQSIQNNAISETNAVNRGAKTQNLHMVRETNMPAALIECGFISSPSEENKIKQQDYQNKLAYAISMGILDYFNMNREDVNGDGKIDVLDLAKISTAYNSVRGKTGWNDSLDINYDNVIDLFDLIFISKRIK